MGQRQTGRIGMALRGTLWLILPLVAVLMAGCDDETVVAPDTTPPAVPTGVYTVTGDGVVSVYWYDLYEADLAGYAVYRHDGNTPETGPYYWLGDVGPDENYDPVTYQHWFDDTDVVNGQTYYYAVLSFDTHGNESELSFETVSDTPRPEGIDLVLYDRHGTRPDLSGFDFSRLENGRVAWDDPLADIFVEFEEDGVPWVVAARPSIVALQDYGTIALVWVDFAPADGYSRSGRAELIPGHSYIVRIAEDPVTDLHYAKFQVVSIGQGSVVLDWAYQIDNRNPELSVPDDRRRSGSRQPVVLRY